MLEKPNVSDKKIIDCLQKSYGITIVQIQFLPLGADLNAAVYRVVSEDNKLYFVKLRRGIFDNISIVLPKFLSEMGITQIIPPLKTRRRELWTTIEEFKLILYPFVEGKNGYEAPITEQHWKELGVALHKLHRNAIPFSLIQQIPKETYSSEWRKKVTDFLNKLDESYSDPTSIKLAEFLKKKCSQISNLVERTDYLASLLAKQDLEFVVCHTDIHAGNLLIDTNDALYIVDWDQPLLAPKERDLMFIGGGLMGAHLSPHEEETLFYQAYGQTSINAHALTYYRYERILRDIAEFCEQLFLTDAGGADREQSLFYLKSIFVSKGVLEAAVETEKRFSIKFPT